MWPWQTLAHTHDWEEVEVWSVKQIAETQPNWEFSSIRDDRNNLYEMLLVEDEDGDKRRIRPYMVDQFAGTASPFPHIPNKVCIECGACADNVKEFVEMINNYVTTEKMQDRAARERVALAKKMWKDGCHGKS